VLKVALSRGHSKLVFSSFLLVYMCIVSESDLYNGII